MERLETKGNIPGARPAHAAVLCLAFYVSYCKREVDRHAHTHTDSQRDICEGHSAHCARTPLH